MVKGNRIKGGARTPPRPTVNGFSSSDSALMSKIQGPTYAGMGALSKEVDPYEMNREPVDQDAFEARMENHPTATGEQTNHCPLFIWYQGNNVACLDNNSV